MKRMPLCLLFALMASALLPASGRPVVGAIDTDVNPDNATVYLDGKALGKADDFDGWPDLLYLPPGTHAIDFRLEGYERFQTTVEVAPWTVVRIEKRLVRVPPSEVRDAPPEMEENTPETPPPSDPVSRETARLALTVTPENAVIYLDKAFWISGEDLARMHSPLQIPAGKHTLLCYAPGHEETLSELDAEPGELIELEIVLDRK